MNKSLRKICQKALKARQITSIDSLVANMNTFMCHINQEPEEYKTNIGTRDSERRKIYKAFEELIEKTSLETYLDRAVDVEEASRLPASCKEFAEVSVHLAAVLLQQEVYIIGRVNPKYARIKQKTNRKHHLNTYLKGEQFIFFDSSVYKQVRRMKNKELQWLPPTKSFNPADIGFKKFIQWEHWLQRGRKISPLEMDTHYTSNKHHKKEEYTRIIIP